MDKETDAGREKVLELIDGIDYAVFTTGAATGLPCMRAPWPIARSRATGTSGSSPRRIPAR